MVTSFIGQHSRRHHGFFSVSAGASTVWFVSSPPFSSTPRLRIIPLKAPGPCDGVVGGRIICGTALPPCDGGWTIEEDGKGDDCGRVDDCDWVGCVRNSWNCTGRLQGPGTARPLIRARTSQRPAYPRVTCWGTEYPCSSEVVSMAILLT